MSTSTAGVQATPAAPAAKPESSNIPTRQQVFGSVTKAFAEYHGLVPEETEAPDETAADAPDSESAAEETETALSQDESETPAASSEETAETEATTEGEEPKPDDGPALTKGMQKRIAKLEEKHQREVEELKAQLAEQQSKPAGPTASAAAPAGAPGSYDPVEAQPEVVALRTQEQEHQRTVTAGRRALADLETDPDKVLTFLKLEDIGEAQQYIREQVEQAQDKLSGIRSDLSVERRAARQAITAAKAQIDAVSKSEFPWVSDPKDPRSAIRKTSLEQLGPYAHHPSAPLFSAVWADWVYRHEAKAKNGTGTTKPAPPKASLARRTAAPPAAQAPRRGDAAGVSEESGGRSTANAEKARRGYFDGLAANALRPNASTR